MRILRCFPSRGRMVVVLFWLFFSMYANLVFADTQTEVKEYLLKAIDFTCYSSFQCDNLKMFLAGEEVTLRYYHYGKNDEEFYTRYEKNWGNAGGVAIFVSRPDGDFFWRERNGKVIADTVIKTKTPLNAVDGLTTLKILHFLLPPDAPFPHYAMSSASFDGIACHKITVEYPSDDTSIAIYNRMDPAAFEALPEARKSNFRSTTPVTFELLVGRKNFPFIVSYRCYDFAGENIISADFFRPEFVALTEADFHVPEVSVEEVQSKKEFERVAQKEYAPPGALANYFSKARVWLKRNWPTFGGMAALGVAMLSAIGVIAVKVWKRQKTGKSL